MEQCDTLFPPIYNEDWLFWFKAVQKRSVTVARVLSQLKYEPFAHSTRAASEEFGDLIAEGLYRLIHEGANVSDAPSEYWHSVLEQRFQRIEYIAARLVIQNGPVAGSALMSLAAARKRLTAISPLPVPRSSRPGRQTWMHGGRHCTACPQSATYRTRQNSSNCPSRIGA